MVKGGDVRYWLPKSSSAIAKVVDVESAGCTHLRFAILCLCAWFEFSSHFAPRVPISFVPFAERSYTSLVKLFRRRVLHASQRRKDDRLVMISLLLLPTLKIIVSISTSRAIAAAVLLLSNQVLAYRSK